MQFTSISELLYKFWHAFKLIYQYIGGEHQQETPVDQPDSDSYNKEHLDNGFSHSYDHLDNQQETPVDQLDFDSYYKEHLDNGFSHSYGHLNKKQYDKLSNKTKMYFLNLEEIFKFGPKDFKDFFNFYRQYYYTTKFFQLRKFPETAEIRKNMDIYLSFLQCICLFNHTVNYMHGIVDQDDPSTEHFSPVERELYKLLFTSKDGTNTFYGIKPKFQLLKKIENFKLRERKIIYAVEIDFLFKKLESRFANFFKKYEKSVKSYYAVENWFYYLTGHLIDGMGRIASYLKEVEDCKLINYKGLKPMLGYLKERKEISYSEDE